MELKSPWKWIGKKNTVRENERRSVAGTYEFSAALLLAVTPI